MIHSTFLRKNEVEKNVKENGEIIDQFNREPKIQFFMNY